MKNWVYLVALAASLLSCKRAAYEWDGSALIVVNGGSSSLSIVDATDFSVRDVLTLDKGSRFPHHIYLSPGKLHFAISITDTDLSGGHAHGSDPDKDYQVLIFETQTGKLKKKLELEGMAHNAVFSPDGRELWLGESGDASSQVHVYDTERYKKTASIAVGAGLSEVTFSVDGTRVYAANTLDNTLSIIDPEQKQVIKTLSVGSTPVGAWPASNGRMYLDNEGSYSIMEIDVEGDSVLSIISLGSKPGYASFHESSNTLWVSDAANGKVVIFEQVASVWTMAAEVETGADAHAIVFSDDGTYCFVSNQGAGTVSVINTGTRQKLLDISVEQMPNGMAFVP